MTQNARREMIEDGLTQSERVKRWKKEKKVMRRMVRKKKKECWHFFCEENGDKDPLEIVKLAKGPWHLKASMGDLTDTNGVNLNTTETKVRRFVRDHFGWRKEGREIEDETEKEEGRERQAKEIENLICKALSGMSNVSAPVPDDIGYKLIKAMMKTCKTSL